MSHASLVFAEALPNLRVVDFGGQREYLYTHPLFCTSRAVYVGCVPLDTLCLQEHGIVLSYLREYFSMVQARAPRAPVLLVFTKADTIEGVTPDYVPSHVNAWMRNVVKFAHAEFPQVQEEDPFVVSSKDGWDTVLKTLCERWAKQSVGANDVMPHSYSVIQRVLQSAGVAHGNEEPKGSEGGGEESKGREGRGEESKGREGGSEESKGREGGSEESQVRPGEPQGRDGGGEELKHIEGDSSATVDVVVPTAGSDTTVTISLKWGAGVPIALAAAVRGMVRAHEDVFKMGNPTQVEVHNVLMLLHHMGHVVYGGALHRPAFLEPGASQTSPETPVYDLSQLVVLDPQWLADMLSQVVTQHARRKDNHGHPLGCGHVPLSDMHRLWEAYPWQLHRSFLELLFALEIAFPGMDERCIEKGEKAAYCVVPALLPPTRDSDFREDFRNALQARALRDMQVMWDTWVAWSMGGEKSGECHV